MTAKQWFSGEIMEFPNYNFPYVRASDYQACEDAFSRWKAETSKDVARIAELNAALRLIADCTPIPGPGFSLVLSMVSVARKALDSQSDASDGKTP
jgi:hypothetical protein